MMRTSSSTMVARPGTAGDRGEDVTRPLPYLGFIPSSGHRHDPSPAEEGGAVACHRCHSDGGILTPYPSEKHEENRS